MKKVIYQAKQVRIFLSLLLLILLFLAWKFHRQGNLPERIMWLAIPAAAVAMLMIVPRLFFPVYRAILIASSHLGNLIFAVISIIVFFLILTPLSLAMKLFGKKFMNSALEPARPTYYEEAEGNHDMEKQF